MYKQQTPDLFRIKLTIHRSAHFNGIFSLFSRFSSEQITTRSSKSGSWFSAKYTNVTNFGVSGEEVCLSVWQLREMNKQRFIHGSEIKNFETGFSLLLIKSNFETCSSIAEACNLHEEQRFLVNNLFKRRV